MLMLVGAGGVLSLVVSLYGYDISGLFNFSNAVTAGISEEAGKLLAVILIVRYQNKPYILNGCLAGAAVGAGFAAFESAGYSLMTLLHGQSINIMLATIFFRGI
jgi:RsiW-degrading membrane proteinase PrsW (M82 family)